MNNSFSSKDRNEVLQQITLEQHDLLIIGGGITGSGIALDAASRGMKAVVVEMQDYAAGTSSRSTKLVHGGLRYLKQFEMKMVAEVGKERAVVYENGPHVTTPERMLLPMHKGGTFGKFTTSIALKVYDYLAGVKRSERRKMLNVPQTLSMEPLLKQQGLKGGGHYVEYRTDDARLTIEVLKEAVNQGAKAVNYAKVEKLLYSQGKVIGVHLTDQLSGKGYDVYARKIVNAAGPWVDTLREMDQSKQGKTLQLTKGIHLVIDQKKFPLQQAVYFDTPDKRMVFAIPRDGKTYVGTTDTVFKEDIAHPRMTLADRKYVIDAINYMFPSVKVTVNDVESSWAGVRPLIHEEGKDPSEISRKDEIWQSNSGLLTIAGGKLTGYRKMAELIVDRVADMFQQIGYGSFAESHTKYIPISGGNVGGSVGFQQFIASKAEKGVSLGLTREIASAWAEMYGSNVERLYEISQLYKEEGAASGLSLDVFVRLRYAIQEEMAVKPVDFFVRRTCALYFNIQWVSQWKSAVIAYMAQYLNWTSDQTQLFTAELEAHMNDAVVAVDERR